MSDCPIDRYKKVLEQQGIAGEQEFSRMEDLIREEISAAFEFALSSRKPTIDDAREKVYA
jgi:pyruvate dehydrogenase E1 component alpha subunit